MARPLPRTLTTSFFFPVLVRFAGKKPRASMGSTAGQGASRRV
jgi:hypothetical protein